MSKYRYWQRTGSSAFWFLLFLAFWIGFAPIQLGGQAIYIMVAGNSMEPGIHNGDLVIARPRSDYQVGDIVTYRNAELGRLVLHRIIGQESGRFIFQGDNNSWVDSYRPTREEMIGKAWIQIPLGGQIIQWLRLPINMAIIAGTIAIFFMATLLGSSKKEKNMNKMPQNQIIQSDNNINIGSNRPNNRQSTQEMLLSGEAMEGFFYILMLIALASLVLGIFVYFTPFWHDVPFDINYQQSGEFSYSASAPPGIYDSQSVGTGQPIFLKLTCEINMQFSYMLTGDQLQDLAGTHQLSAMVIENKSGWRRTFPLEQQTAFSGNFFTTSAPLNLCQMDAMLAEMEQQTGLQANLYSIVINPNIAIGGKVSGQILNDTYQPELVFHFDRLQAYLVQDDLLLDPLKPVKIGIINGLRTEMNTLSLFGLKPKVSNVGIFSLIGFLVSISGLLILWQFIANKPQQNEGSYMPAKYGSLKVDDQPAKLEISPPVLDVASKFEFSELAKLHNSMILHYIVGFTHFYQFKGDGLIYQYRSRNEDGRDERIRPEIMYSRLTIKPGDED